MITCYYCGAKKLETIFVIGASSKPDWCMIYGTEKMACPDCYTKASKEGSDAVDRHVRDHNEKIRIKEAIKTLANTGSTAKEAIGVFRKMGRLGAKIENS